ncbi:MAG: glycosyltransferase family 1 protein, partial [Lachnospiraceae bacterium]|nr:glycosyltransferase family 1 protein [Lachnospiraceae bacterium]
MEQKNLIFIRGRDAWQDVCMEQLIDGASRRGLNTYVIDYRRLDSFQGEVFHEYISRPGCVLLTFQGNGIILNDGTENIWAKHHIPVYSMMYRFIQEDYALLEKPGCDIRILAADRQLADLISGLCPGIKGVRFLPFGGTIPSVKEEKTNDVLILGDCERERSTYYEKIPYLEDDGVTLITSCVAEMIGNPGLSAADAIRRYFDAGNEVSTEEQFSELLITVRQDIEETVNRFFKQELIQALDRAGIPMKAYGKNWEAPDYILTDSTKLYPAPAVDERLRLYGNAKIAVVFSPECHEGCCSDLPTALLSGSLCVTEPNPWLAEKYQDGMHLIYLDHTNPNQAVADIQYLLAHPDRCAEIA